MAIHWTKRPQNFCRSCGYSWYPRGKSRSAHCPQCGSTEVELALEGCLRAIGYLIALPFLPLLLAVRLVIGIVTLMFRGIGWVLRLIATIIGRSVPAVGRLIGTGAVGISHRVMPAVHHATPVVASVVSGLAATLGKHLRSAGIFTFRWVASVKDDLQGEADREVNPVSLIAKLLVIAGASSVSIIMVINIALLAVSVFR